MAASQPASWPTHNWTLPTEPWSSHFTVLMTSFPMILCTTSPNPIGRAPGHWMWRHEVYVTSLRLKRPVPELSVKSFIAPHTIINLENLWAVETWSAVSLVGSWERANNFCRALSSGSFIVTNWWKYAQPTGSSFYTSSWITNPEAKTRA